MRWGVMAAVLIGAALCMGDAPPKPADEAPKAQQQQAQSQSPKTSPLAVVAYDRPDVLARQAAQEEPEEKLFGLRADGWVAVFTLILTIATILLWVATEKTIRHAREASRHELRAYVSARPVFMVAFDDKNLAGVKVAIENSGNSPAFKLVHQIGIDLLPFPFEPGASLPALVGDVSAPSVLFPRAGVEGNKTASRLFTPSEIAAVKTGKMAVCVYGEVVYFDIFKERRWTKFCSYVAADTQTLRKLASAYKPTDLVIPFAIAPMGNDAE